MITLIAAVAKNGVIGKDNTIPWNIPEERQLFKKITLGKPVIMGVKTYESIGHPLPERANIVLSKEPISLPGCTVCHSIEDALQTARAVSDDIYIIGGGEIYSQTIAKADRLLISHINEKHEGDVLFPVIDESGWHIENEMIFENFIHITYTKNI